MELCFFLLIHLIWVKLGNFFLFFIRLFWSHDSGHEFSVLIEVTSSNVFVFLLIFKQLLPFNVELIEN